MDPLLDLKALGSNGRLAGNDLVLRIRRRLVLCILDEYQIVGLHSLRLVLGALQRTKVL